MSSGLKDDRAEVLRCCLSTWNNLEKQNRLSESCWVLNVRSCQGGTQHISQMFLSWFPNTSPTQGPDLGWLYQSQWVTFQKNRFLGPQPKATDRESWRLGPEICTHSNLPWESRTTVNRQYCLLDHEVTRNKPIEKSV